MRKGVIGTLTAAFVAASWQMTAQEAQRTAGPSPAAQVPAGAAPGPGASGRPAGPAMAGPAVPAPPPINPATTPRANEVLAQARQALGGDKLAAIKTLVANGRTRRVRGNNLVPIEFEWALELPGKYVRKDESPAEESDPTSAGFNGDDLIQIPAPTLPPAMAARPGGPPPPTPAQLQAQRRARVLTVKQDFVRFAIGLFADSFVTYPLTFGYAGSAEAPQGKADVIDVRGEGSFALRLFVNAATHVPIMVSWQLPPTNVIITAPGQPAPSTVAPGAVVVTGPPAPAAGASQAEKDTYAKEVLALRAKAQGTPVEHRIYFADYRDVDGVQFPFRLRRAIGTETTEETTFDRYRINSKVDPKKFDVVK